MDERLFLPPDESAILQGDLFALAPSVMVSSLPMRALRYWTPKDGRQRAIVHSVEDPPTKQPLHWDVMDGGEPDGLVRSFVGRAVLLTHDCEVENDDRLRTLAMVRPVSDLDEVSQKGLFSADLGDGYYSRFPLEAQSGHLPLERAFVDFRRLTTVTPAVLDGSLRVASASPALRKAMAEAFWQFLFRPVVEGAVE